MNRKDYQKPAMKVVKLQQRHQLLAGSVQGNAKATMNGTWDEEEI